MPTSWINPKIVIGNTATGEFYFPRPEIENSIWEEIDKGNHVLMAAPRRVGKSSIMQAMLNSHPEQTRCIFRNIQGIKSEDEYYQRFYEMLIQCLHRFDRGLAWLNSLLQGVRLEEVTLEGVKFGEKKPIDFRQQIKSLLTEVSKAKIRVVLLLDELPEVLNSLSKQNRGDEATHILNHLRELRQNPEIRGHLSIVLAGSVGIQHVVKAIEGRISDLNDFNPLPFEPMSRSEARSYIVWATQGATVQYNDAMAERLLDHVKHFIPYFINIMLDEINRTARKAQQQVITEADIDTAFATIVKNSDHFKEWKYRLNDYFTPAEARYLHDVLTCIAHEDEVDTRRLYDLAVKADLTYTFMELVRGLMHDGYLLEQDGQYSFISPFLQTYWKLDNPIYERR